MQLASWLVKTLSHTVQYFFLVFDITFLCAFLIYLIEIRISSKYMDSSLFGFYVWCVKGINLHMYKYHDNNRSISSLFLPQNGKSMEIRSYYFCWKKHRAVPQLSSSMIPMGKYFRLFTN